jgi:micrococcal nuclease
VQYIIGIVALIVILAVASHFAPWIFLAALGGFASWFVMRRKQHPKRKQVRNWSIGLLVLSLIGFLINSASNSSSNTPDTPGLAATSPSTSSSQLSAHVSTANNGASAASQQSGSVATSTVAGTSTSKSSPLPASSGKLIPVVVTKDVDGDTIHVRMPDGHDETIRMLLIDTPETVDPRVPVEPFGPEASNFAKHELPVGRHIYIEEGVPGHARDKYGRLLAYVYITPKDMYNEDVVRRGLARVAYVYPPNTQHLVELQHDQQYAKSHHLGIWSIPGYVTDSGYNIHVKQSVSSSHASSSKPSSSTSSKHHSTQTGLTIVSFTSDVNPGDYATITVKTTPGTTGYIEVDYYSGPSHASGLVPKTANSSGIITWTWKVGTHTRSGDWPVIITAGSHTVRTTLHVH